MAHAAKKLERSRGALKLSFKRRSARTVVDQSFQAGSAKVRFPRTDVAAAAEAVLINTSGGLTDGDIFETDLRCSSGTDVTVATQAAERIYRSRGDVARICSDIEIGRNARLCWLPQETIVFNRGALDRQMRMSVRDDSEVLAVESLIFGRTARSDEIQFGAITDGWQIFREGQLVFADRQTWQDSDLATMRAKLDRRAVLGDSMALATIISVGGDLAGKAAAIRQCLDDPHSLAGVSTVGPVVVARLISADGQQLRTLLQRALAAAISRMNPVENRPTFRMPRIWQC